MRILTLCICTLFLLSGISGNVVAGEEKRHSGVETSAEHRSEEGLEHGKAYAGTQEKGSAEEKRHSGTETSAGHKDEERLEHGKAYVGSNAKKVRAAEEEDDGDKGKSKKQDKSEGKKSK